MGASARRFEVDETGIGVLAEAFPLASIRAILKATGREGTRKRLLPASMMVYYVIALGLFVSVGCREVLRRLLDGAMWIWPDQVRVATEAGDHAGTAATDGRTDRSALSGTCAADRDKEDARRMVRAMACGDHRWIHAGRR